MSRCTTTNRRVGLIMAGLAGSSRCTGKLKEQAQLQLQWHVLWTNMRMQKQHLRPVRLEHFLTSVNAIVEVCWKSGFQKQDGLWWNISWPFSRNLEIEITRLWYCSSMLENQGRLAIKWKWLVPAPTCCWTAALLQPGRCKQFAPISWSALAFCKR